MLYLNSHPELTTAQQVDTLVRLLPLQRQEAALRHTNPNSRRESVLAYKELCRGLQEEYGISAPPLFDFTPAGKPLLADYPHIHFSLSHCRKAVGCLIGTQPCGLDIETIRPLKPDLVRHTMNADECAFVFGHPKPEIAFIRLWTRKEAVLKLRGTGIAGNLHEALSPQNLQGIRLTTSEYVEEGFILTCALSE